MSGNARGKRPTFTPKRLEGATAEYVSFTRPPCVECGAPLGIFARGDACRACMVARVRSTWTMKGRRGQALVEFAIVVPVLLLFLLGTIGTGLYFLAGVQQASASATVAGWAAANPTADPGDLAAFAATVSACPVAVVYAVNLVTVTLSCPTIAGELVPVLPRVVVTTATAFVP